MFSGMIVKIFNIYNKLDKFEEIERMLKNII